MKVLKYPDPRLRQNSIPVTEFNTELRAKISEMYALMRKENGIGLAAPQVGWNIRLFVMNVSQESGDDLVIINPELIEARGGDWLFEEACLSLPGISGKVKRAKEILIQAQDSEGRSFKLKADGLVARCILHEMDHLSATLFIDKLSPAKKLSLKNKLKKLEDYYEQQQNSST